MQRLACCLKPAAANLIHLPMPHRCRFGGAGLGKAAAQPWDRQTLQEVAAICAYMAWSPLLLWLIRRRWAPAGAAGIAGQCGKELAGLQNCAGRKACVCCAAAAHLPATLSGLLRPAGCTRCACGGAALKQLRPRLHCLSHRPEFYLRRRSAVLVAMRIVRTSLCEWHAHSCVDRSLPGRACQL